MGSTISAATGSPFFDHFSIKSSVWREQERKEEREGRKKGRREGRRKGRGKGERLREIHVVTYTHFIYFSSLLLSSSLTHFL